MIGGQHLIRGHNAMLTWVTCVPSVSLLKAVYRPAHKIQAPLRSSDGSTLLTDQNAILQHWSEHSEGLFRDQRIVNESSLA